MKGQMTLYLSHGAGPDSAGTDKLQIQNMYFTVLSSFQRLKSNIYYNRKNGGEDGVDNLKKIS